MSRYLSLLVLIFLLLSIVSSINISISTGRSGSMIDSKIHPNLLSRLSTMSDRDTVDIVIRLKPLPEHIEKNIKGNYELAKDTLKIWSKLTQFKVVKFIVENGGIVLNRFWIDNVIVAKVKPELIMKIASLDNVIWIFENFEIKIPRIESTIVINNTQIVVSWGILRIQAPDAWSLGYTGEGVRIAVLDTGVDITHPALAGKMLSVIPGDPYYPGGWMEFDSYGNPVLSTPHDTDGHGTHCSGIALGGDTSNILIGVAPGAILMHGLVLPGGIGTFAQVIAGMEWSVEPYYLDNAGNKIYTNLPAHVVSMSWGAYNYYGNELLPAVKNMLIMNIIPVAAIGNGGPGTTDNPGNIWGVFGIGATDIYDNVAWFSGGAVVYWPNPPVDWPFYDTYPSVYVKPDFSAPGVFIVSSVPGGWYEAWSGTSMATPHVAGIVALILQVTDWLYYSYPDTPETVYEILVNTSIDYGDPGQDIRYGWGLVNAYNAVLKAEEFVKTTGVEGYVKDSESGEPVTWAKIYVEETNKWYSVRKYGYFKIPLDPGVYNLTFTAWGYYNKTIEVEVKSDNNAYTYLEVYLDRLPHGYVKGIVMGSDGVVLAGAKITVLGTPVTVKTDQYGSFRIWLPEGSYEIVISAPGYSSTTVSVSVSQSEEVDLGVIVLIRIPRVAVMWDYAGSFTIFINNLGYYAKSYTNLSELNIDLATGFYDAVIYSGDYGVPFPEYSDFIEFLEIVDSLKIGVIFMDSWGDFGYGIKVLNRYIGDPAYIGYGWGWGPVFIKVNAKHPIFHGYRVGDYIMINWAWDADFSWFQNFTGIVLGDVYTISNGGFQYWGSAIGVKVLKSGAKWILLSSFAITSWNTPRTFTYDYWIILINSINYAISKPLKIELENPYLHVGDTAVLNISEGEPFTEICIFLDDVNIGNVTLNERGRATFRFKIPLIPGGEHVISAVSVDEKYYGFTSLYVLPKLVVSPSEIVAPGSISIEVTGLQSYQMFHIYLGSNLLTTLRANESGAHSDLLYIPLFNTGNYSIKLVDYSTLETLYNISVNIVSKLDELENSIKKLNGTVNELNLQLIAVIGDIAILKNNTNLLAVKLDQLNITMINITDLLAAKLNQLNGTVIAIIGDIAILRNDTNLLAVKLDQLNTNVNNLTNRVDSVSETSARSQVLGTVSLALALIALIGVIVRLFIKS